MGGGVALDGTHARSLARSFSVCLSAQHTEGLSVFKGRPFKAVGNVNIGADTCVCVGGGGGGRVELV